jgi:hypothetical protein
MAHLKSKQTKGDDKQRYKWKLTLVRMMVRTGWDKSEMLNLFDFIDYVMTLPKELDKRLGVIFPLFTGHSIKKES